jgi:hypothetical protein
MGTIYRSGPERHFKVLTCRMNVEYLGFIQKMNTEKCWRTLRTRRMLKNLLTEPVQAGA